MSVASSTLFQSLSLLAVILSGTALFISQQQEAPQQIASTPVVTVDNAAIEESVEQLRSDLLVLQGRLDLLEQPPEEKQENTDEESATSHQIEASSAAALEARVVKAVDEVMERRGVEYAKRAQRAAKAEGARDGMSRWVRNAREKLPNLHDRITAEMNLDYRREQAVQDLIDSSLETMSFLTDQLHADPPLDEFEQQALMGEVKQEVGTLVEGLDEILEDSELIELGVLYSEEVDPRVGGVIINEGKEGEEEAGEGDAPGQQ